MVRYVGVDPSTKTGIVILDRNGERIDSMEIRSKELGAARMVDIIDQVIEQMEFGDKVAIEGFSYGSTGRSVDLQYGIGWGIRTSLYKDNIDYLEVAPAAVKKFASGKGNTKKDELAVHIYKRWGFEDKSDNIRDAFVLAQIARVAHLKDLSGINLAAYQRDVLKAILEPPKEVAK